MKKKIHIWLVEDSETDEFLMRRALTLDGIDCEFQVSEDGEKATLFIDELDRVESCTQPHIVLLDLHLPRKSGSSVLERIRQSPRCGNVPVVIVTSSGSFGDKDRVSRLGATRYFQKPVDLSGFMKLGPLVREVLNIATPRYRDN